MTGSSAVAARAESVRFRDAAPADVPRILQYIRDLAVVEGLLHEVTATEVLLETALFGPQPKAFAVMVEDAGVVIGFALYFHNFSTFQAKPGIYVEDAYLEPAYRGRGIGSRLFGYLAQKVLDMGGGRLNWWVLDENTPAVAFYNRIGAEPQSDWTVYKLEGDALKRVAQQA